MVKPFTYSIYHNKRIMSIKRKVKNLSMIGDIKHV
nr:MAG TPA: hypothetical protein [Bacteriophage sp.]